MDHHLDAVTSTIELGTFDAWCSIRIQPEVGDDLDQQEFDQLRVVGGNDDPPLGR
jgi:hypothetical protein